MRAKKLVLKRFVLGQSQPGGPFIEVEGRAPGFLSFVLNLMGVDPTLSLRCFGDRVEVVEAGLGGRETVVIPLGKVSVIVGGHSRSVPRLVAGGVFALFGFFGLLAGLVGSDATPALVGGVFWLFLAAVMLASFFLSRSMVLAVQSGGDKSYGLRFGQGVIAGVDVNPERVQQAVAMLNRATMDANAAISTRQAA